MTIEEKVEEAKGLSISIMNSLPWYAPVHMAYQMLKAEIHCWVEAKEENYKIKEKFKKFMEL